MMKLRGVTVNDNLVERAPVLVDMHVCDRRRELSSWYVGVWTSGARLLKAGHSTVYSVTTTCIVDPKFVLKFMNHKLSVVPCVFIKFWS